MRTRVAATGQLVRFRSALDEVSGCIAFTEIKPATLSLIYDGLTKNLRTLDAIHLASALVARDAFGPVAMLTLDERMRETARALDLALLP